MPSSWKTLAIVLSFCLWQAGGTHAETASLAGYRLSGPAVHGNLAIYFVHGQSRSGPVPLTLQEALAKKTIEVRETGQVNELEVENTGDEDVFIQSGDIVKGGKQDRVLSVSLIIPPRSGAIPVRSFCVESGRWSARGGEDVRTFSSANAALPSRAAKMEMAGAVAPSRDRAPPPMVGLRQKEIWRGVAQIQSKLSNNLGAPVAATPSHTSLQLTLENSRLEREVTAYAGALQPLGERDDDIVGYAFAVNGKLNSADVYPSNALFRKMWPKLLRASAIEAIGERDSAEAPAPPAATVTEFIAGAEGVKGVDARAGEQARLRVKESAKVLSIESRPAAAPANGWMHRSYIAK